jgi:predicted DNA-binding transcriptional regulator AlpA
MTTFPSESAGAREDGASLDLTPEAMQRLLEGVRRVVREEVARLAESSPRAPRESQLIDAARVAQMLGVDRAFVYEHAVELGAVPLGKGRKPRLRFKLAAVEAYIASCSAASEPVALEPRRRRRRHQVADDVTLLPIRGRGLRRAA